MKKKRILITGIAIIIMIFIITGLLFFANGTKDKIVIRVEGFDVEYTESDRKLTVENFESIELGNSLEEIENKLGEPDTWIGSGILRPVYFLQDMRVVVFHFKYPAVCEDLEQVVMISENGESQAIKEK